MVFRDQRLSCEKCGKPFFFTVTEQRRMAEHEGMEAVEPPTLCRDCRSGTAAPPAPRERSQEPEAPVEAPRAERPPQRQPSRETIAPSRGDVSLVDAFPHEEDGIEVKLIGTVKWFSRAKGYGFITKADGQDLFFHRAELAPSSQGWPEDGQQVEFQIRQTAKGPEAFNVSLLPTD